MKPTSGSHITAILQAMLVTFLWSTSFIIIKWGLTEIPPLTYAGLRYFIAFLCFIPFLLQKKFTDEIKTLNRNEWIKLFSLGIIFYSFTQGAQFLGLWLLPSVTVSLMLNFTPLVVAILGIKLLSEKPTNIQWIGGFIFITGILIYFLPLDLEGTTAIGLVVMVFGVFANAGSAVLGRNINRGGKLSPLIITAVSMGIGSFFLIIAGLLIDGIPSLTSTSIIYLIWLAVINTAFAFTLWNRTLQTLSAMESSIINGTMLIQIAILAWLFNNEVIELKEIGGMLISVVGAFLVNTKNFKKPK
ncbi:MAG: EamA family transporter [Ignavibacteriaceae bacterium]|nr:EamA family transporter [Ignavibacteriaceae bacterium]